MTGSPGSQMTERDFRFSICSFPTEGLSLDATVAAHLVAAERHGRIHRLVAIDPDRAGTDRPRELVRLAHVARPHAAAQTKGRGIAALDHLLDVSEGDGRDDRPEDLLLGDDKTLSNQSSTAAEPISSP